MIPDYFDVYYKLAVAVYCCGSGIAIIVMPILTQFLLNIYGWRGTLLLLTGVNAQSIVCGALLPFQDVLQNQNDEITLLQNSRNITSQQAKSKSKTLKKSDAVLNLTLFTNITFMLQVMIPGFVWGYTYNAWLIYIVSFALSNGASIREASIVATSGGIGLTVVRALMPLLQRVLTDKQLMHISSYITAISLSLNIFLNDFMSLCFTSLVFGAGFGILGAELYVIVKGVVYEADYVIAVAWLNLVCGFASIASGFLTGNGEKNIQPVFAYRDIDTKTKGM